MSTEIRQIEAGDSRFLEQSFSLEWQIDNFGKIPFADVPSLKSPHFHLGGMIKKSSWQLKLYKRVRMNEDSLGFRLGKEEGHDSQWYCVRMDISVAADGMHQVCLTDAIIVETANPIIYVHRHDFDEAKVGILYASHVTVTCSIVYVYQDDKIPQDMEDIGITALLHEMELLYKCKLYSDITLVAESIEIPAHKCVLSTRGFKRSLIPDELRVFKLDLKDSVAIAMLDYIYTAKLPTSTSDVYDLFRSTRKYGLCSMRQRCEYILAQNNIEIVCSDGEDADSSSTSTAVCSDGKDECRSPKSKIVCSDVEVESPRCKTVCSDREGECESSRSRTVYYDDLDECKSVSETVCFDEVESSMSKTVCSDGEDECEFPRSKTVCSEGDDECKSPRRKIQKFE